MNTVVIYKSKTGFTKKYAEWIAEELSADIYEVSIVKLEDIKKYDVIVYGGSLYAVGINGIKFLTKNLDKLKDKKIVVFATGASSGREDEIKGVVDRNFTPGQQKHIKFFYLRGGFDYNRLNIVDKLLMTLLKWKLKRKKELTSDEKGMLAAYSQPIDFTNKKYIDEVITYIKS